jgi:hypothetical protein
MKLNITFRSVFFFFHTENKIILWSYFKITCIYYVVNVCDSDKCETMANVHSTMYNDVFKK